MFSRLNTIIVIKKTIILAIILSQKTSCNLNFYIDDSQFEENF